MKILILSMFLLDRFFKYYFINYGSFTLNKGIAFGAISDKPQLIFLIQLGVSVVLILYLIRSDLDSRIRNIFMLIICGSVSNLLDRVMYNGIVDYFGLWVLPKFNLADVMVVAGVFMLVLFELNEYIKNHKSFRR